MTDSLFSEKFQKNHILSKPIKLILEKRKQAAWMHMHGMSACIGGDLNVNTAEAINYEIFNKICNF